MKHFIDPTIDVVFAALFGAEENKPLLIHFLNSTLELDEPITNITFCNTIIPSGHLKEKKAIIDILAKDDEGIVYQIEMQTTTPSYLVNRMLHNWSSLYKSQIKRGEHFSQLYPKSLEMQLGGK